MKMKKKKITIVITAIALLCALALTAMAYDSSEDPIVSLSYLTDIFRPQILRDVDSKIEEAVGDLAKKPDTQPSTPATEQPGAEHSASAGYEVVELKAGEQLFAVDAIDIMLRAGRAGCIAPDANQGIADYTDATEILNGDELTKNHMCLIPRGDGRGVEALSESVFIMVRGEYYIVGR